MPDPARPLIVLHSPSYVLKRRELQRLVGQLLTPEDLEYCLEQYWAGEDKLEVIAAAIPSASLLADSRVVVVHEMQTVGARDQKLLMRPLENIPPGTTVVLTCAPKSDRDRKKPPLSADIMKLAGRIGEVRQLAEPGERQIAGWITQEVAAAGRQIEREAVTELVNVAGTDVDRLANEIAKLMVYVGDASVVTVADVRAAVSGGDDRGIFDLVDAIGRRDAPTAIDIIRALMPAGTKRGAAIGILGMIARQIRLLWQAVHTLKSQRTLDNIPDQVKAVFPLDTALHQAHSFVQGKLAAQARNFTEPQLARALVRLYETDLALKGMSDQKADERTVLELLVVSLCQK